MEKGPRHIFLQRFYRAIMTPLYSKEDLTEMHPLQRQVTAGLHVQELLAEIMAVTLVGKIQRRPQPLLAEIGEALDADHIDRREDATLNWMPITVDEEGWRDTTEILDRALRELQAVAADSRARLGARRASRW